MPLPVDSLNDARKPRGPEPLRRKRVQPTPVASDGRRKLLNVLLGFAAVVLLVDALIGEKGFMDRMRASREYDQRVAELQALRTENAALRSTVIRLDTDPSAIEEIAREEMGLMKRGELLFIIRDAKPAASRQPISTPAVR